MRSSYCRHVFILSTLACIWVFGDLAMAYPKPESDPNALVEVSRAEVRIGIPRSWKEAQFPAGNADMLGMWSPDGKGIFDGKAFLLIHRNASNTLTLDPKREKLVEDTAIHIGARAFRRVVVTVQPSPDKDLNIISGFSKLIQQAKVLGLISQNPGKDGKYLMFLMAADAKEWPTFGPLFEKIVLSIRLDGQGTEPVSKSIVTVTESDRFGMRPLAGANVIIGKRISLEPQTFNYSGKDKVVGDVIFQEGVTEGDGSYIPKPALPPGHYQVILWKAGHVPQQNLNITIPGAAVKADLNIDSGPGSTGRHTSLESGGVFRMKTPAADQSCLWGRITQSDAIDRTKAIASGDAVIVVGENLSIVDKYNPKSVGFSVDLVQGDMIYAVEKTKADGTFAIPLPLGSYSVIIWKQGAFVPFDRQLLGVWPGQTFYHLKIDDLPGETGRHRELDLNTLGIPRKTLDSRPGIRGVIRVSDRGVRKPLAGATVLLGQQLRLRDNGISDEVWGNMLNATTLTNEEGEYHIAAPPGTYQMIFWAKGCTPQQYDTVTIPPGVSNVTLIRDTAPGSTGRHLKLDTSRVPKPPPPPATSGAIQSLLPGDLLLALIFAAAPPAPELTPQTVGNVKLNVPADARRDTDTPKDEGIWILGPGKKPEGTISLLRDVSFEGLVELFDRPTKNNVARGETTGTRFRGTLREPKGATADLLVFADPEAPGRQIALSIQFFKEVGAEELALIQAIQDSLVLPAGRSSVPTANTPELKELFRTDRIPDFRDAYAFVCYEDRVWVRDDTGKKEVSYGVAGAGKTVGSAFRKTLTEDLGLAQRIGEAVTNQHQSFGGKLVMQLFENGAMVQEKATGKIWSTIHTGRPKNLRPREEITRYPRVVLAGREYDISVLPQRVILGDTARRMSQGINASVRADPTISEPFQRIIEREKLSENLGRVMSAEEQLFDSGMRVQVFDGGVLIAQPDSDRFWWCFHPKRSSGTIKSDPVQLPKEASAVAIRLDYVGGYTPPRKSNAPYLEILADGHVTLTDPFGHQPTIRAQLKPENVLEFLKFAVEGQDFLRLDTAVLKKSIDEEKKKHKLPTITDLPTTAITIRTADAVHEVRVYAPHFYAENCPDLKGVQQFEKVHARLANYMEKLRSTP